MAKGDNGGIIDNIGNALGNALGNNDQGNQGNQGNQENKGNKGNQGNKKDTKQPKKDHSFMRLKVSCFHEGKIRFAGSIVEIKNSLVEDLLEKGSIERIEDGES